MNRLWTLFRSYPYISNVVGYTTLFASADLIQQSVLGDEQERSAQLSADTSEEHALSLTYKEEDATPGHSEKAHFKDSVSVKSIPNHSIDLAQTARVALVGFFFHSNFNYHWLRALERMFPGGGAKRISLKVLLDQLIAAPATISAFYIGLSTLEGKEDPFADWKNKFWASYKTGVVYWSTMQAVNFSLVPPVARTVFAGGIALGWTIFLCHFRQQKTESHTHT
ncbi:mpv17-like protein [Astyanax mexicanus]|uniref:Mpv17-like protein n=1 Tax=Astyanax mexicanus TaxID=7994 RepID=A0A8T2M3I8_ASTMX|nr:mpv17-like protein [Astyanax mexicanus]XP_049335996.1 mpv17-like protein [Astyanax mexicanus]KAG9276582.1 mpv17-like protein [Astyanax mexicanus]